MIKDEEKFHGFFRMNIKQFYRLSQLVAEEIRKPNTNYKRAITPDEQINTVIGAVLICWIFRTFPSHTCSYLLPNATPK
jgi:hypothetical protein